MEEYDDDPEYQKWIEEISKHCTCCTDCLQDTPCGGVMAGGLCDNMCHCDHSELSCDSDEEDDDWFFNER